jgi:hypothetical protein
MSGNKIKYELFNISWDTDGERVKLPKKEVVEVESDVDISLEGADILSDKYGWCVNGFKIKRVGIDIEDEISRACEFMWCRKDDMSLREFADMVKDHLGEKYIVVTSKRVMDYLVDMQ